MEKWKTRSIANNYKKLAHWNLPIESYERWLLRLFYLGWIVTKIDSIYMQFFLETRKNCSLWKAIWIVTKNFTKKAYSIKVLSFHYNFVLYFRYLKCLYVILLGSKITFQWLLSAVTVDFYAKAGLICITYFKKLLEWLRIVAPTVNVFIMITIYTVQCSIVIYTINYIVLHRVR